MDAFSVCKTIGKILEMDIVRSIAYELWGKNLEIIQNNRHGLVLNIGDKTPDKPHLRAFGIGTAITGAHADDIVFDDIVTLDDRISHSERERTKLYVAEVVTNVLDVGGASLFLGTKWHAKDVWSDVERYTEIRKHRLSDGAFTMTAEEIAEKQKRITPLLWNANYELTADDMANQVFKNPRFGVFLPDEWKRQSVIMHIDASYGGEDSTAVTIKAGCYMQGWLFRSVQEQTGAIKAIWDKYRVRMGYCETNADKGYLAKVLNEAGMRFTTYFEAENKKIKIMTYLYMEWSELVWDAATDAEYLEQILDWTEEARHDDAPDSAATICRLYGARGKDMSEQTRKLLYGD
jgi:hypothetical protein